MVARMAELALQKPNQKLLEALTQDSQVLEQIRDNFSKTAEGMQLACAYEELPMRKMWFSSDGIVSNYDQACLSLRKEIKLMHCVDRYEGVCEDRWCQRSVLRDPQRPS